ncbi:hypothetical protein ACPA9J_20885 [Pseudomonas aeruginosa]
MRLVEDSGRRAPALGYRTQASVRRRPEHDRGQFAAGIYSSQASEATYAHLHQLAAKILQAGYPVVIDAAYLKQNPAPGRLPHRGRDRRAVPDPRLPGARSGDRRLGLRNARRKARIRPTRLST